VQGSVATKMQTNLQNPFAAAGSQGNCDKDKQKISSGI